MDENQNFESGEEKVIEVDPTNRFERYQILLGHGAFKQVWKAFDQEEGFEVAWNILRIPELKKQKIQEYASTNYTLPSNDTWNKKVLDEIEILKSLNHPNIINIIYAWYTVHPEFGPCVCFITELMTSGTLKSFLRKTKQLKLKVFKHWCFQILSGLHYLHTRTPPIIHRDLKCENIFINGNNGQMKIGDLGLAVVKSRDHVSTFTGTPQFIAPELYDEKYDEKVDVYAFGLCMLEMITKEYPYAECTNQAQIYRKVTQGIKPKALEKVQDEQVKQMILWCTEFNPDLRPNTQHLLEHPFWNSHNVSTPTSSTTAPFEESESNSSTVLERPRSYSVAGSISDMTAQVSKIQIRTTKDPNVRNMIINLSDGQELKFEYDANTDTPEMIVNEMRKEELWMGPLGELESILRDSLVQAEPLNYNDPRLFYEKTFNMEIPRFFTPPPQKQQPLDEIKADIIKSDPMNDSIIERLTQFQKEAALDRRKNEEFKEQTNK